MDLNELQCLVRSKITTPVHFRKKTWMMDKLMNLRKADPKKFFNFTRQAIEQLTQSTCDHHLTPELRLRLVTPRCYLWHEDYRQSPFNDPYWAFYWPGGEALTRYVLDNKNITEDRHVLDIGSGCGSLSIAAAKLGVAASITANDIDPVAAVAIKLNSALNECPPDSIKISTDNIIGNNTLATNYDCVLLGDMFYNEEFGSGLIQWLLSSFSDKVDIFIGDPVRHEKFYEEYKPFVEKVAEYEVSEKYMKVNELKSKCISVWKMSCK